MRRLHQGNPHLADVTDALEALQQAEDAAKESAATAAAAASAARVRVDTLAAELTTASRADEFTDRLKIQLEQSRLRGRLEGFTDGEVETTTSETVLVLQAALDLLKDVTAEAAAQLFRELDAEIFAIGRKLGIDNLDAVELNRNGGMRVVTAGVEESFKNLSGGERVRLRVAVVVALLRVGHRSGVGSHPGLVLLDSPVLVASDEPAAVQGHLAEDHIYSSLDGSPLW